MKDEVIQHQYFHALALIGRVVVGCSVFAWDGPFQVSGIATKRVPTANGGVNWIIALDHLKDFRLARASEIGFTGRGHGQDLLNHATFNVSGKVYVGEAELFPDKKVQAPQLMGLSTGDVPSPLMIAKMLNSDETVTVLADAMMGMGAKFHGPSGLPTLGSLYQIHEYLRSIKEDGWDVLDCIEDMEPDE